jgi:hypothetical protein
MGDMTILIYKESYFCHPLRNVFPGISQPSYNHLCMKVQVIVSENFETILHSFIHLLCTLSILYKVNQHIGCRVCLIIITIL